MLGFHIGLNVRKGNAAHTAHRAGEVFVDDILGDAHSLKDLAALVALDGGNAHLGGNLHNAAEDGVVVVLHGCIVIFVQQAFVDELADGLMCQIGIDGAGTVAQQSGKVVHLARLCTFQDQASAVLFLVRIRYCETAETASRLGMVTWYSSTSRSERMMIFAPSL